MFEKYAKEPRIDREQLRKEHFQRKDRASNRRRVKYWKQKRLYRRLSHHFYKPSIWAQSVWNEELQKYVDTGRIRYAKNSKAQKTLKKQSRRIVRHLPLEELPRKGNHYRKYFDYWWIWI